MTGCRVTVIFRQNTFVVTIKMTANGVLSTRSVKPGWWTRTLKGYFIRNQYNKLRIDCLK